MDMEKFFPKIPPRLIAEHDQYEAEGLKWWMSLSDLARFGLIRTAMNLGKDDPPDPITEDQIPKWVACHMGKLAGYAIGRLAIMQQQQQEEDDDEPEK